jgi:hypothetical protein
MGKALNCIKNFFYVICFLHGKKQNQFCTTTKNRLKLKLKISYTFYLNYNIATTKIKFR